MQVEMSEKEQKVETLQSKVSEVKNFSQSQETPAKLQVIKMLMYSFGFISIFIFMFYTS